MQVKTNLFANEAYVNYADPYHVVLALQMKDKKASLNRKQIVMGSILQQIGFRLLHAHHLRESDISEGQVLYQTCKYGNRVAEMLFGKFNENDDLALFDNTVFTDEEINAIIEDGNQATQPILFRLNRKLVNGNNNNNKAFASRSYHDQFDAFKHGLPNQDTALVKIKKSTDDLDQKVKQLEYLVKLSIFKYANPGYARELLPNDVATVTSADIAAKNAHDETLCPR